MCRKKQFFSFFLSHNSRSERTEMHEKKKNYGGTHLTMNADVNAISIEAM